MRFGPVPVREGAGSYLAHSQRVADGVIRKGTRLDEDHVARLLAAGIDEVTLARLGRDDVHEDEAAHRVAQAVAGDGVRVERPDTGRANLFAQEGGLVVPNAALVDALNAVDPAITLATLAPYRRVAEGRMVGTVKIIPFAVSSRALDDALAALTAPALSLARWQPTKVAAISTLLPSLKESVIDKTLAIFQRRLAEPGAQIVSDSRVPHALEPLAACLRQDAGDAEITVVFGASAVVDATDVIPAAIEAAGGRIEHLGMPVDPGNLLVLGEIDGRPVIGAPGCARSPKANGFDFVLDRLLAGVPVRSQDIVAMGVGGLLTDTAERPRPRRGAPSEGAPRKPAAIVLAAGRSTRMGSFKLVENIAGVPMVRRVVETALASRASPVVVVTGHEEPRVKSALAGLDVRFVHNTQYADGLSTSLRAGLLGLPSDADAALILLGDMPLISAGDCDRILQALGSEGTLVAMATANGARGNPVAWSSKLFAELRATEGDAGGRTLMSRYADNIVDVEIGEGAALDADTPAALEAIRSRKA